MFCIRELLFLCSFTRHLLFEKDMQLLHRQSVEIAIDVIDHRRHKLI